jgi:hypothetical protein
MEEPALGAAIVMISSLWTFVEDIWGAVLGMMVGTHQSEVGIAIYQSLTGTGAQRAVLNEMADLYLPEDLKREFAALMKVAKKRAAERNAIVHGIWCHDKNIPDAIILAPRYAFSRHFGKLFKRIHKGEVLPPDPVDFSELIDDRWLVYRPPDLFAAAKRIAAFGVDLDHFFDRLTLARGYPIIGQPARPPLSAPSVETP